MTRQGSGLSKLFVGVDYGTTYSGRSSLTSATISLPSYADHVPGIAYALSGQTNAENVKVITAYPEGGAGGTDGSNEYIVKVPSRIAYHAENEGKRNFPVGRDAWGYEVEAGFKSYSWIKLLLDSKATATDFDDPILQKEQDSVGGSIMTLPEGKTAIDVTTDYLTNLYRHCIAEINKTDIKTVLPVTPIEFWFTHPATWSDEAKAATKQAAERAGFTSRKGDTITLIPEPEAGAIAALRSSKDSILGLKAGFQ